MNKERTCRLSISFPKELSEELRRTSIVTGIPQSKLLQFGFKKWKGDR